VANFGAPTVTTLGVTKMDECCICEGLADYITIEGGWYVCKSCIEDGKTDGLGA